MKYLVFGPEKDNYPVALLTRYLKEQELRTFLQGIEQDVVAFAIEPPPKSKNDVLSVFLREHLSVLLQLKTQYILVTEANLFKLLTKQMQVSKAFGYVFPCVFESFTNFQVIYIPSPGSVSYDKNLIIKLNQGLQALQTHREGCYQPVGNDVIKTEYYPKTLEEISNWLDRLVNEPLAIDIEAFGLKHYTAGIGTISMSWNKHEGIAFPVDYKPIPMATSAPFGRQVRNEPVRALLREFFRKRTAWTIYHNISYDVYILIYQLFMRDLLDTEGLLEGMEIMLQNWDDTKLITYLATNSCTGNDLSLKEKAQEFAGNYALDVIDITTQPLSELLRYNLVDGLCTWFVYEKYQPGMIQDQQEEIYLTLFKPCIWDIIQMQLTGMPLDMDKVQEGKQEMLKHRESALSQLKKEPFVEQAYYMLCEQWVTKRNNELKKKRVTLDDATPDKVFFNFNSNLHLQLLLYEIMQLPIIDLTDTQQPATGIETLASLQSHTQDKNIQNILGWLIEYKQVEKILSSFIPAFEAAPLAPDGIHYVYGFYTIGGTVSARLSSNSPNMQNLPASNTRFRGELYSKIVKRMFRAPEGWLFVGVDFSALEDRISALTTKDPNKLKIYTEGYDSHSLRAFYYFQEQMPDIVETVDSINSVKKKYGALRQDSKGPTFALTYQGTWKTLVNNCGFSEAMAKQVEARYHLMYEVSDQWTQAQLNQARVVGYVTVAFGLRLRTPLLALFPPGKKLTSIVAAEGRTAGNALGQSYCLLNSRAAMAFMKKVRASEHRLDVKPTSQIHDAQYYLVRDDAELLEWVNIHLIQEVEWQSLPEIQHPDVKLEGDLFVFYPSWATELRIPNNATAEQIRQLAQEHIKT